MKKKSKIILFSVLAIILIFSIIFWVWVFSDDTEEPVEPDIKKKITVVNDIKLDDNGAVYKKDDIEVEITETDDEEKQSVLNDASKGDLVSGTTKDGAEFEGRGDTIFVKKGETTVKAHIKTSGKKDVGKVAGVVSAVTDKAGYSKNNKNWNTDYSVYYIEQANCLLYYPAQLTLKSANKKSGEFEFYDPRSKATLTASLSDNDYSCMDDIESELVSDSRNQVLASGTDWYSAETYSEDKTGKYTLFSLYGFGNKYVVNVHFKYEDNYSFVFEDLRKLIKCKFVDDGVWVSNETRYTVGDTVSVLKSDPAEYDPKLSRTSYYFDNFECVLYYPDIFTKAYRNDDGSEAFTDPGTGAYILMNRIELDTNQTGLQDIVGSVYGMFETELTGEFGCKGRNLDSENGKLMYAVCRDGYLYSAFCTYPADFDYVYSKLYNMLEIAIPGDDISSTEVKDVFYTTYSCNVTVPLQWNEYAADGDTYFYRDDFNNLTINLSFSEITDPSECENLYNMFNVVAKDSDIIYGEYYVKWHNADGAYIGAVSAKHACLIEIPYPNAYSVYENCWKRMGINFSDEAEYETPADKVRKEVAELMSDPGDMSDPVDNVTPVPTEPEYTNDKPNPTDEPEYTNDKPNPTDEPEYTNDKPNPTDEPEYVNDKPNPEKASGKKNPKNTKTDNFKSDYDMLMNSTESFYNRLPFSNFSNPVKEDAVCGDFNTISYELTDDEYYELLDYIDSMYDNGFVCESSDSYDYEGFINGSWIFEGYEADTGLPDMRMYLELSYNPTYDAHPSFDIMFFYLQDQFDYIEGALNIDYASFDDYEDLVSFMTGFRYPFYDIRSYFADRMNSYYCISKVYCMLDDDRYDYEYDWFTCIEFGHISRGYFIVDEVYVDSVTCGLFKINNGYGECIFGY